MTSLVLAIETSQRSGGVALLTGDGTVIEEAIPERVRHDDDLIPAIDRIVARAGATPRDLGAIGVSIGPGGFTGLRIAVATAKMLAIVLDARLVAVPTALVVATAIRADEIREGPALVALAAKRETVWATTVVRDGVHWRLTAAAPVLAEAATIPLEGVTTVVGDRHLPDAIVRRCEAARIPIVEPRFEAGACLAVTRRLLAAGQVTDPLRLAPLYPREPEAVRLWNASLPPEYGGSARG